MFQDGLPAIPVPICMDGRLLGGQGTGVATYAQGLLRALPLIGLERMVLYSTSHADSRIRRLLAASQRRCIAAHFGDDSQNRDPKPLFARDLFRRAHVHFSLYGKLLRIKLPTAPGVMHWTYPVPMVIDGWANIYTVHDLIPLSRPELSDIAPERLRATLLAIAREASRILTVSDASRNEIAQSRIFDGVEIVNAGQVVEYSAIPSEAPLPCGLKVRGFFLFCGSLEPRKNLVRLLRAYRQSAVDLPLVLVGPVGANGSVIQAEIGRSKNVIRLGFLPREDLVRLISSARAVLFPSLAEGFGLPVAEAMAAGTAAMASEIASLREIAGHAALFVDPYSIENMANAIAELARNDALVEKLQADGINRSSQFNLITFASRLSITYQAAISDQAGRH